jgi:hypothetical protein
MPKSGGIAPWIPACAGMTDRDNRDADPAVVTPGEGGGPGSNRQPTHES